MSTKIIAEISCNHCGSFDLACKTIKAAKDAGADGVKLQAYTADTMTMQCDKPYFKIQHGLWKGKTYYDLYDKAKTPFHWLPKLEVLAKKLKLEFIVTVFDETSLEFLENNCRVDAYKIASFEINHIPLLKKVSQTNKPVIISTGVANERDIDLAKKIFDGCNLTILKCVSEYPAKIKDANLLTMKDLNEVVGVSDHTKSNVVPITAAALGAVMIEKHFMLKDSDSFDKEFSLTPAQFRKMVTEVRKVEKALGKVTYELTKAQLENKRFSRSIFAKQNIKIGESFNKDNVCIIRPNYGLHPKYLQTIYGMKAKKKIERGTPITWELVG